MNIKSGSVLAAIGIGAFLGVVAVCGGMGAAFLWLIYDDVRTFGMFAPVTGVTYTLTGPESVRVGEAAMFTITVTNTDESEHRTLHSIDLYTELVDQGEVTSIPAATSFQHNVGAAFGSLLYYRPLSPGATEVVEVELHPTRPGKYSVNFDVCIDTEYSFIERFHDLTVLPADAGDKDNGRESSEE